MSNDASGKPPAPGWWEDENGGWHPPAGKVGKAAMDGGQPKTSDNNAGAGCLGIILILAVLYFIGSNMGGNDEGDSAAPAAASDTTDTVAPEPTADELEYAAFSVCTEFVKDQLKAPATASFRNYFEDDGEVAITGGPDAYIVSSTVDSENSFGANIRSTFICQVAHVEGDTWRLEDMQIL